MSDLNKSVLIFSVNGQSVEGHPIGAKTFIKGDVREEVIKINGIDTPLATTGTVLFDRPKDGANRPWFIFDFETGRRVKSHE